MLHTKQALSIDKIPVQSEDSIRLEIAASKVCWRIGADVYLGCGGTRARGNEQSSTWARCSSCPSSRKATDPASSDLVEFDLFRVSFSLPCEILMQPAEIDRKRI